MEKRVHSVLRLINTPTRTWNKYQMMSYQLTLRKMNLNKKEVTGDDRTIAVPLTERTHPRELSVLQYHMDHVIFNEILTKQPTMPSAAR